MKWEELAGETILNNAIQGMKSANLNVIVVNDKSAALAKLVELLPENAEVMTASSITLNQIGFVDYLTSGKHKLNNLKDKILAEKDQKKQQRLRLEASLSDYYIGSVHAITERGELIAASATGSQLAPYAYTSQNVILVVGTQKIVKDIDEGLKRIREYTFPLEDKRMKGVGYPGSMLGKILIIEKVAYQKVTVILVKEKLGF